MSTPESLKLPETCRQLAQHAKAAAARLARATGQQKNQWLRRSASALREQTDAILQANEQDIQTASGYGLTDAQIATITAYVRDQQRIHGFEPYPPP